MKTVIFNLLVSYVALLILFLGIKRKMVVKSRSCYVLAALALAAGCMLFDVNGMCIWALLVFHSYTDITEGYVYSQLTWSAVAVEVLLCITGSIFTAASMFELVLSGFIITALSKLMHAYADGDMEIFLLILLSGCSTGYSIGAYAVAHMFMSCVIFIIYTGIMNLFRIIRHKEARLQGAFVPAIAAGYFILNLQ